MAKDFDLIKTSKVFFNLIYYNQMNLAFKSSPENLLEKLDTVTLELLQDLKTELIQDLEIDDVTSRTDRYWIYGFRSNKRVIFLFFEGKLTLTQFTQEQK